MRLTVSLFAILRERAGHPQVEVELGDGATVADAIDALAALPGLSGLTGGSARMAVNREYASPDTALFPGDELALIPPVSGGAAEADLPVPIRVELTGEPLDLAALVAFVTSPRAGGVVTFQGMPRDVPALEYEAYHAMAEERIEGILTELASAHGLIAAAAAHRVGRVPAQEASIVVAVSAPHRDAAFRGAREALDRIKAEAPIWKVEVDLEGERRRVEGVLPR